MTMIYTNWLTNTIIVVNVVVTVVIELVVGTNIVLKYKSKYLLLLLVTSY